MSVLPFQVLVIIDVKPKDLGLPTEAYISVEEIHDVSESTTVFLTIDFHLIRNDINDTLLSEICEYTRRVSWV